MSITHKRPFPLARPKRAEFIERELERPDPSRPKREKKPRKPKGSNGSGHMNKGE
jgi:hypothetical protein